MIQAAPSVQSGDLAKTAPAGLLASLARQKASGLLELTRGTVKARIFFQDGLVRYAQSNVRSENAGGREVDEGKLKAATFDRAVAFAKQAGIALHEALVQTRAMTPQDVTAALKRQTIEVATGFVGWTEGTFSFVAAEAAKLNRLPDVRVSAVHLALTGAKRAFTPSVARTLLRGHEALQLERTAELERELFTIRNLWNGEQTIALLNGKYSVSDIVGKLREDDLGLLAAIVVTGLGEAAAAHPAATTNPTTATVPGSAPHAAYRATPNDDAACTFTEPESQARAAVFAERDRQKNLDHYQVLGVAHGAQTAEIKSAYFALARRFHSDAYSGLSLGSATRVLTEVFQRIGEAQGTLADAAKRKEYDVYVDRKARGLPTDVGAILKAESVFQRGTALLRTGKANEAEAAFREALALNSAEADFHAQLAVALLRGRRAVDEARSHLDRALELDPKNVIALAELKRLAGAGAAENSTRG